jgi:hypothetical protein
MREDSSKISSGIRMINAVFTRSIMISRVACISRVDGYKGEMGDLIMEWVADDAFCQISNEWIVDFFAQGVCMCDEECEIYGFFGFDCYNLCG